jgi:hypothetical protein
VADKIIGWAAYESFVRIVRTGLDDRVFDAAWSEGRRLSIEQAIDEALQLLPDVVQDGPKHAGPRSQHGLTARRAGGKRDESSRASSIGDASTNVHQFIAPDVENVPTRRGKLHKQFATASESEFTRHGCGRRQADPSYAGASREPRNGS